jgi:hypothetical protein
MTSIAYLEPDIYSQNAQPSHPEYLSARKARLVEAGLHALAQGDLLAVAVITCVVKSEVRDA